MVRSPFTPKLMGFLKDFDEASMPSSCRILRVDVEVTSGVTEYTEPEVISGPVPCRLMRELRDSREADVLGRPGDEPLATVALPLGTEAADLDKVEVTTDVFGTEQVELFDIQGDPWVADYGTSLTVRVWRQDERHAD